MAEPDRLEMVKGRACAYLRSRAIPSDMILDAIDYVVYGDVNLVHSLSSSTATLVVEAMRVALIEVCGGIVNEAPGDILERFNHMVSLID